MGTRSIDMRPRLDTESLALASAELTRRDDRLGAIVERHGIPPLWARRPGFPTLVRVILEQQVSLASGRAAFARLEAAVGAVTPERVAAAGPARLRSAGLTRQKAAYVRGLALAVARGAFDPAALARMTDDEARGALMALHGVGRWTADVYLLMALRRPDVWPSGDLALATAAREALRLRALPGAAALDRLGERWRPYRAVAARILWHHYLSTPRRRRNGA